MFEITVVVFSAGLAVVLVWTLSKPDARGRARWRSLITPTPVDALPTTSRNLPTHPLKSTTVTELEDPDSEKKRP